MQFTGGSSSVTGGAECLALGFFWLQEPSLTVNNSWSCYMIVLLWLFEQDNGTGRLLISSSIPEVVLQGVSVTSEFSMWC